MKRIILLITLGLILSNLWGEEIKERDVLIRQANRLTATRKYMLANELLDKILVKSPGDVEVITKMINNHLLLSEFDKAEQLLEEQRRYLSGYAELQYEVRILLAKSQPEKAYTKADQYLDKNIANLKSFEELAGLFESYRAHDQALEFYLRGREAAGDPNLFTRRIANTLDNAGRYREALPEYLKQADQFKSYKHYVLSRVKKMLDKDESLVELIADFRMSNDNSTIIEIYAEALAYIGDTDAALQQFLLIDNELLIRFGKQQAKLGSYDIALDAYQTYIEHSENPSKAADAKYQSAEIMIAKNDYQQARVVLNDLYADSELRKDKFRYRTRVNLKSRILLSRMSLILDKDPDKALRFLDEAEAFAYNEKERNELAFKKVELNLFLAQYNEAELNLNQSIDDDNRESDAYREGVYYRYLLALFRSHESADSHVREVLIYLPGDKRVNDALMLNIHVGKLNESSQSDDNLPGDKLLDIYREYSLFRSKEQVDSLLLLASETESEVLYVLALEWAIQTGYEEIVSEVAVREFLQQDYQQFAKRREAECSENSEVTQSIVTNFLSENPQSVFSPQFRRLIAE